MFNSLMLNLALQVILANIYNIIYIIKSYILFFIFHYLLYNNKEILQSLYTSLIKWEYIPKV